MKSCSKKSYSNTSSLKKEGMRNKMCSGRRPAAQGGTECGGHLVRKKCKEVNVNISIEDTTEKKENIYN